MQIIKDNNFQLNNDSALVIGKFDGIHRGHRELLDRIIEKKAHGLSAVVFTFDKSPAELFSGKIIPSLTTIDEKRRIFEYLGIDTLIEYPLTKETAAIDPTDYITKILCKQSRMKYIAAGTDLSFGHMGRGNSKLIESMSKEAYRSLYEVEIVNKIIDNGEEISSSLIREVVSSGDMEKAERLIGVPYAVSGMVTHGRALGRKMGFPTVNIEIPREKLVPPFGVYFAEVSVEGEHYKGITNIGVKPTVTDSNVVFAETNIFDFDEDIYGKRITVKLLKFSRKEEKFDSIEALKKRIDIDMQECVKFFGK